MSLICIIGNVEAREEIDMEVEWEWELECEEEEHELIEMNIDNIIVIKCMNSLVFLIFIQQA